MSVTDRNENLTGPVTVHNNKDKDQYTHWHGCSVGGVLLILYPSLAVELGSLHRSVPRLSTLALPLWLQCVPHE